MKRITVNYRSGRSSLIGAICAAMQQNGSSAESINAFAMDNRDYTMRKLCKVATDLGIQVMNRPNWLMRAASAILALAAAICLTAWIILSV
jgi:hypothetical protein